MRETASVGTFIRMVLPPVNIFPTGMFLQNVLLSVRMHFGRKCIFSSGLIFRPIRFLFRHMSLSGIRSGRLREIFTGIFASFFIQIFIHFLDPQKNSTEKPVSTAKRTHLPTFGMIRAPKTGSDGDLPTESPPFDYSGPEKN